LICNLPRLAPAVVDFVTLILKTLISFKLNLAIAGVDLQAVTVGKVEPNIPFFLIANMVNNFSIILIL